MAKKRINIYVDEDIYAEFKQMCALGGETITSVIDQAMKEYNNAIKMVLEAGDKDKLMAMIQRRLDIQMTTIESDIDKHLESNK